MDRHLGALSDHAGYDSPERVGPPRRAERASETNITVVLAPVTTARKGINELMGSGILAYSQSWRVEPKSKTGHAEVRHYRLLGDWNRAAARLMQGIEFEAIDLSADDHYDSGQRVVVGVAGHDPHMRESLSRKRSSSMSPAV